MNYYVRDGLYGVAQSYKKMIGTLAVLEEKEKMCKEEVERLQNQIIELEKRPVGGQRDLFRSMSTASLYIPIMTLKLQYIKYIEIYGVPDDGYFIPELLAEFA
jgi:hypothetical protein